MSTFYRRTLREVVKKIVGAIPKADGTNIKGFGDKHVAKPTPWGGEKEDEFKSWTEKFTSFMAGPGDKKWRNIIKEIPQLEDEELEDLDAVQDMLETINIDPNLAEDHLETMYDQLTQHTKGDLLADIRPMYSIES